MRSLQAAFTALLLALSSFTYAEFQIDSIGAGYWIDENPYIEVYQETDHGLHPQVFLGYKVAGISVKTDHLYEKFGFGVAPYFGLAGTDDSVEGLLGIEVDKRFNLSTHRLDTYFRINVDLDDSGFMLGARYFFNNDQ